MEAISIIVSIFSFALSICAAVFVWSHHASIREHNRIGWLRQNLYKKLDRLSEISTHYWLCEEDDISNRYRAVLIKGLIKDIEEGSQSLALDISKPMQKISNIIMTDGFADGQNKEVLAPSHEKFTKLHTQISKIKEMLVPPAEE